MNINLDIIIPCYNSKKTLFNTLSSINIQQEVKGFKVYLVNDKSKYDYQEEVSFFSKFFEIQEIKLEKNIGPGGARNEGIKRSKSEYIMFMDSDDILYDCFSLRNLYKNVLNHDLCISHFILERDNIKVIKHNNYVWLHGKVYKRKFLVKNNIYFNNTRANEDNGFNRLILLLEPKIIYLDKITYVYKENASSITRKNDRKYKIFGLKGFIYNMKWAIDEALARKVNPDFVPYLVTGTYISMYYDYLYYKDDKNVEKIIEYCKDLLPYYKKYGKATKEYIEETSKYKDFEYQFEDKKIIKHITFDEFMKRIEEYD